MRFSNSVSLSNSNTRSIYFIDSRIAFLSSKVFIGLESPFISLTLSSESKPTMSLSPNDLPTLKSSI